MKKITKIAKSRKQDKPQTAAPSTPRVSTRRKIKLQDVSLAETAPKTNTTSTSRNMADPQQVRHKVTTFQSPILPFAGRKDNGKLATDLDAWISQVDAHISANAPGLSDQEQLSEARRFLDLTNGDLSRYTSTQKYVQLQSWKELATYLKKVYASIGDQDVVTSMARIFSAWKTNTKSYKEISTPVWNWMNELQTVLEGSDWIETHNSQKYLSTQNLKLLMNLALLIGTLTINVIKSMTRKWLATDGPYEMDREIEKHLQKLPDWDSQALKPIMTVGQRSSRVEDRGRSHQKPSGEDTSRHRSSSRQGKGGPRCYNCNRQGHFIEKCSFPSFCAFHKVTGHKTSECRARQRRNQSSSRHRYNRRESVSPESRNRNQKGNSKNNERSQLSDTTSQIALVQFTPTIHMVKNTQRDQKDQGEYKEDSILPLEVCKITEQNRWLVDKGDYRPLFLAEVKHGKKIVLFMDTGSPRSFMEESVFNKYFRNHPMKPITGEGYSDLHGNQMDTIGEINICCKIAGKVVEITARIVRNVSLLGHVLVGTDVMRKYNLDICRGGEYLTIETGRRTRNRVNVYLPKKKPYQDEGVQQVKGILNTK